MRLYISEVVEIFKLVAGRGTYFEHLYDVFFSGFYKNTQYFQTSVPKNL